MRFLSNMISERGYKSVKTKQGALRRLRDFENHAGDDVITDVIQLADGSYAAVFFPTADNLGLELHVAVACKVFVFRN